MISYLFVLQKYDDLFRRQTRRDIIYDYLTFIEMNSNHSNAAKYIFHTSDGWLRLENKIRR